MGKLINAIRTNDVKTSNGMVTNSTTLNNCVDLFFKFGTLRGKSSKIIIKSFSKAFNEDPLTSIKLLFWVRDIRGGAGERETFKVVLKYLANDKAEYLRRNLNLIPEYGRWDDLLVLIGTKLEIDVLDIISQGLVNGDALLAKWLPNLNTKNKLKKSWANTIRKHLKMTPKEYRKTLSNLSNTVENLMCSNRFDEITFSHVPSKAMSNYMNSFNNRDNKRFNEYLESLSKGEAKINSSAIYPYDVIKNLKKGNNDGATEQWKSLPNYMEGNKERVLPMVDVSGSMNHPVNNNPNLNIMDIAISLGLYISERNLGPFKDSFLTFDSNTELNVLNGNLNDRFTQLKFSDWGYNTNIQKAFELILNKAKESNLTNDDMPTMIIILSDMEFDVARTSRNNERWDTNAQNLIKSLYNDSGYTVPKIVYWNLHSVSDNNPVQFDETGTCLISGFSPSILKTLLSGSELTPYSMMMKVINNERYDLITI
jgi:hypothetical protein